jgi:hypothetical protein
MTSWLTNRPGNEFGAGVSRIRDIVQIADITGQNHVNEWFGLLATAETWPTEIQSDVLLVITTLKIKCAANRPRQL